MAVRYVVEDNSWRGEVNVPTRVWQIPANKKLSTL